MNQLVPEAYCDALIIMNDAPRSIVPMSVIEMHLFSYLGCVLALFQGKPIGEWGYSYSVTSNGFPFSVEFDDASKNLLSRGLVNLSEDGLIQACQPGLTAELETVFSLGPFKERRPCLRSATECALAFPLGSIRHAISQTPGMATSVQLGQRSTLLDRDDVTLLYDEYRVVSSVLETGDQDLLSPAVIWLSARILRNKDTEVGI